VTTDFVVRSYQKCLSAMAETLLRGSAPQTTPYPAWL
jgi:hypothetical protein